MLGWGGKEGRCWGGCKGRVNGLGSELKMEFLKKNN